MNAYPSKPLAVDTAGAQSTARVRHIFTFGLASPLASRYVVIPGGLEASRRTMQKIFGGLWATQYPENTGLDIARRNGLTELDLGELNPG